MSDEPRPLPARLAPPSRAARPRFGKIRTAVNYSGLGRTKLYEVAADNPGLFRKSGATTLVDFEVLDEILDNLPVAIIKPGGREKFATRDGFRSNKRFDKKMNPNSEETRPSAERIDSGLKKAAESREESCGS
jgi:hypothetical protein